MGRYQSLLGFAAFTVALGAGLWAASPARADLQVCNNSSSPAYIAIGFSIGPDRWYSQGWWEAQKGQCSTVVAGDLKPGTYFYLYAINKAGTRIWQGQNQTTAFCINPTQSFQFTMTGDECAGTGRSKKMFWEVAVKDASQAVALSD